MPELTGWMVRDELVWYEERYYSGNQSLSYMEEDERAQVVLTLQGELLARLVSSKLIPPGSCRLRRSECKGQASCSCTPTAAPNSACIRQPAL
ncbi:hypothetical protein [Micromonospora rosaria]|uniref:hypothetical protein n=1 Tax=Micromonospora rosaria TaxID=47874 RepID=UPI0012FB1616|nr:hypothetical protein [Micromonospora rosaria]